MPRRQVKPSSDRILACAEAVFAAKGYPEVSLRQLIAAAGISTTAFYARFDSKEDVLAALTTQLFVDLHAAAPRALAQARDLESGIEHGVALLCELFAPRRALVRTILAEAGTSPATVAARRGAYALLAAFLASRFSALAGRGRIAVTDPLALAWALVGALDIQITRWAVWDELSLDELRAQLVATARAIIPRRTEAS